MITASVLLFVVVLAWLWRWAAAHEIAIKRHWVYWQNQPCIRALRRRFARPMAILRARLSPSGYLGLSVTVGALVLIGASWLFGGIAEDVISGDPLTMIDARVANWLHHHASPSITRIMLAITDAHAATGSLVMTATIGILVIMKRDWYALLGLVLAVPGGMVMNVLTKHAFHRTRPHFDDAQLFFTGYSFPSGHAATATVLYGLLAAILVRRTRVWPTRVLIVLTAAMMVLLVGFSRLYLGAHYLSDVVAGYAQAVAWLALCLTATNTLRRRAAERSPS